MVMKGVRLARLTGIRHNARGHTLTAKVYDGPASEIGRHIHIPLTVHHLPELRLAVAELEKEQNAS